MKISVIIPTLNEEKSIAECLAQFATTKDVEILVSDGGSKDRTTDIVKARTDVVLIQAQRGRGLQLNQGVKKSTGEILLFLHCDCLLPDAWRLAIVSALNDPGVLGGYFCTRTQAPDRGSLYNLMLRLADFRSRFLSHPYGDSGIFVRREVFELMGGYLNIPIMEDYEFSRRLTRKGRVVRLPYEIRTSARRFRAGLIKATVLMRVCPLLFRLGVSPFLLDKLYGAVR